MQSKFLQIFTVAQVFQGQEDKYEEKGRHKEERYESLKSLKRLRHLIFCRLFICVGVLRRNLRLIFQSNHLLTAGIKPGKNQQGKYDHLLKKRPFSLQSSFCCKGFSPL